MQPASSPFGQTSGGMFGAAAAPVSPFPLMSGDIQTTRSYCTLLFRLLDNNPHQRLVLPHPLLLLVVLALG